MYVSSRVWKGDIELSIERISKDEYYLEIAKTVSKRSTCLKRHYGAVIVNNDEIIATGYNGNPRGLQNCCDKGVCNRLDKPHNSGDYSDCFSVHAEQNAMLSAARKDMIGATLYLVGEEEISSEYCGGAVFSSFFEEIKEGVAPCPICQRMILNSGINEVIVRDGFGVKHILDINKLNGGN